jgi:hypothetical protein
MKKSRNKREKYIIMKVRKITFLSKGKEKEIRMK